MDRITRAWMFLIALSLASTLVALLLPSLRGWPVQAAGLLILSIALAKAGLILDDYLELRSAPRWRRGFHAALTGFAVMAAGLFLAG